MPKKTPTSPTTGAGKALVSEHAKAVFAIGKREAGDERPGPGKPPKPRRMGKLEAKVKGIELPPLPIERVRAKWPDLLDMYAGGQSIAEITPVLFGELLTVAQVRACLWRDAAMSAELKEAKLLLAQSAFDSVVLAATKCQNVGDYGKAGELWLKVAAKADPKTFGDKQTIAHTGAEGGPVEITPTMPADEAYKAMLRGARLPPLPPVPSE